MSKKHTIILSIIFILTTLLIAKDVFGANLQPSFVPSLIPVESNKYYLGTTSPDRKWAGIYIFGTDGCLQLTSGLINSSGVPCGSGGGGSGGGTMSTSSPYSGIIIQYPYTNLVTSLGSSSTTTSAVYFDPINQKYQIGNINTASTTILGNFFLPSLSQGLLYNGSNGLTRTVATTTLSTTGSGISLSGTPVILGSSPLTISNTGVTSVIAGTGISVSGATGDVTISATGGGGTGNVSTSTNETAGRLAYWTTTNGTPAKLGDVATGTLSVPTGLTVTGNRYVIGGNAVIGLDTGYVIPLQSTLDAKALGATTITINGTSNQITSSAGSQDLSANRTWTLSFPNLVVFPSNASSTLFSTSYASTTELRGAGLSSCSNGTTDKVLYNSTTGQFSCGTDQTGAGGSGITTLNGLTATTQTFATSSTDGGFGFSSSGSTHTLNIPMASASSLGLLSIADWTTFNNKLTALGSGYGTTTNSAIALSTTTQSFNGLTIGQTISPTAGALLFTPLITGTLNNSGLTNSAITINGSSVSLGGSITVSSTTLLADTNYFSGVNRFNLASSTYHSFETASSTQWKGGGLSSCSNGTTEKLLYNSTTGQFSCGSDQSGAGGSGSSKWATSTDNVSIYPAGGTKVGIGTTTPFAQLSVAGSSTYSGTPLFSVSSSTPTATSTAFHINSEGKVMVATSTYGKGYDTQTIPEFYVNGRVDFDGWESNHCNGLMTVSANVAEGTAGCTGGGNWQYIEGNAASTQEMYVTNGVRYQRIKNLFSDNDEFTAMLASMGNAGSQWVNIATSTPIFEIITRPINQNLSTTSTMFIGFSYFDSSSVQMTLPTDLVGFIATSTTANWQAMSKISGNMTIVDTGVASSTSVTGTSDFRKFRVDCSAGTSCDFWIGNITTAPVKVATISTNLTTTGMNSGFWIDQKSNVSSPGIGMDWYKGRFWARTPEFIR